MEVTLKIYRFNPEVNQNPYFQDFIVSANEKETVLDALFKAWQQDTSLSFRRSCRSAICGSCALVINGKPSLACHTLIRDVLCNDGLITLEPLPHYRQIKDLVVDLEPFFESLKFIVPWVITRPDHNGYMSPKAAWAIENPATCILCGICNVTTGLTNGIKPVAVVKSLRLAIDPRDRLGATRLQLINLPPKVIESFIKELSEKCPKKITLPEKLPLF